MEIKRAPKETSKSGLPHEYRNDEGKDPERYGLYEPWEYMNPDRLKNEGHGKGGISSGVRVNGGYPTGGYLKPSQDGKEQQKSDLVEYPVSTKPSGHIPFDYHATATRAKRVEKPITKGDRKDLAKHPHNDAGIVRANVSRETGHMVGVTYHPEGSSTGFVRATMGPLDRQTGQHMRQHQDMDSRPQIRRWDATQRGEAWDESHPNANRRVMTIPGREQGSEVMTEAIGGYTGGRRPNQWRNGKVNKWQGGKK